MVDYIQGVILVLFEALICSAFLSSFLQRKHREIRWQMLEVASLAGLYLISAATTYYSKSLLVRGGGQVLAVILVAVIFYQCKLVHVLVLDLAFYGIMIAVDGGGIVISEALFRRNLLENPMFQVMISLLFKNPLYMVTKKTCYGNAESRVDNVVSFSTYDSMHHDYFDDKLWKRDDACRLCRDIFRDDCC